MNFYKHTVLSGFLLTVFIMLSACEQVSTVKNQTKTVPRWINPTIFDATNHANGSSYSFEFDMSFTDAKGGSFTVKNCLELGAIGEERISPPEYPHWQILKTDCEIVGRFYGSPKVSEGYWAGEFDYPLLKTFPATAIPYLGGQGLDDREGLLGNSEPNIKLLSNGEHNVKVLIDGMEVDYVVVARGDFNRDGLQDWFVRMDWYIEEATSHGFDWVVLTTLSPGAAPMLLWRK